MPSKPYFRFVDWRAEIPHSHAWESLAWGWLAQLDPYGLTITTKIKPMLTSIPQRHDMDLRSERERRAWRDEYNEISETLGAARTAEGMVGRESKRVGDVKVQL